MKNEKRVSELLAELTKELEIEVNVDVGPHIRLWKLGTKEHPPSEQSVQSLINLLSSLRQDKEYDGSLDIVWTPNTKLQVITLE